MIRRLRAGVSVVVLAAAWVAWHFPYATDGVTSREVEMQAFYDLVYATDAPASVMQPTALAAEADVAVFREQVRTSLESIVAHYRLEDARVLDVGSGRGYLQDVVQDYTGLDISAEAARYYHKPFVHGTATAMPFPDGAFDVVWSIWMLEHIPNPEAALSEMRRVVRPGGLLYLRPAWNASPWAAHGYAVRPFSDFGLWGKLVKASVPLRENLLVWWLRTLPTRLVRQQLRWLGPTRLRYHRLTPNFTEFWQPDGDAVSRLDSGEVALWFESRGDRCLNCGSALSRLWWPDHPLVIRRSDEGLSLHEEPSARRAR